MTEPKESIARQAPQNAGWKSPRILLAFAGLAALSMFNACARQFSHEELLRTTLVFGGISTEQAPKNADTVTLKAVTGSDAGTSFSVPVKDGVFFNEALPAATYQLCSISGHSGFEILGLVLGHHYEYDFSSPSDSVRVSHGGTIAYAGSFMVVKGGDGKFVAEADPSRSVKELLSDLIPNIRDAGVRDRASRWLAKFP